MVGLVAWVGGGIVPLLHTNTRTHTHIYICKIYYYIYIYLHTCCTSTSRKVVWGFQRGLSPKCRIQLRRAPTTSTTSACFSVRSGRVCVSENKRRDGSEDPTNRGECV